jgi:hypothetical protein
MTRDTGTVPHEASERKQIPLATGLLDYFPDALMEVAKVSLAGNRQHLPGQPLRWAKEKSRDEADALLRHLIDRGKRDADGMRHSAKVAWRALALLQREIEQERGYGYDPITNTWRQLASPPPQPSPPPPAGTPLVPRVEPKAGFTPWPPPEDQSAPNSPPTKENPERQ